MAPDLTEMSIEDAEALPFDQLTKQGLHHYIPKPVCSPTEADASPTGIGTDEFKDLLAAAQTSLPH